MKKQERVGARERRSREKNPIEYRPRHAQGGTTISIRIASNRRNKRERGGRKRVDLKREGPGK